MANTYLDEVDPAPPLEKVRINQVERPQKTFFYKRIREFDEDDQMIDSIEDNNPMRDIFACHEQEAASLNKTKFQQVGVSDGRAYLKYLTDKIKEQGFKRNDLIPIEIAQEIIRGAELAELEVARGHFERPRRQDRHWGGASSDVANPDQARENFLRGA